MAIGRWAAAVNAIDATTEVVGAVSRVRDLGTRTIVGSASLAKGSTGLAREARYGRAQAARGEILVSGGIYHSDADRTRAIAQLETDLTALATDVKAAAGASRDDSRRQQIAGWLAMSVLPTLTEFSAFAAKERASWITRFATDWSTFDAWQERVRRLRELARAQGIQLLSPEPVDLPKTMWQEGAAGTGGMISVLWTALKAIVFAAVGITGVVALYTVIRDIRGTAPTPERKALRS